MERKPGSNIRTGMVWLLLEMPRRRATLPGGQGLSLTLRDARVLRDQLLSTKEWETAGHAYAREHDRHTEVSHTVNLWFAEFYLASGPEADARRARALPLIAEDPSRQPDTGFSAPDITVSEAVKKRFFAED
jgi:menaquinone-9 beta-reductase